MCIFTYNNHNYDDYKNNFYNHHSYDYSKKNKVNFSILYFFKTPLVDKNFLSIRRESSQL